jgi:hypothetical protein
MSSTCLDGHPRWAATRDNGFRRRYDAGARRYADAVMAGTETVLRAVVRQEVP